MKNFSIKYDLPLIAAWSLIILVVVAIIFSLIHKHTIETAVSEANSYYKLNLKYRAWNANIGGLYAPIEKVAPNPWLKVPDRELVTKDGNSLILINPAYMTRLVFESLRHDTDQPIINKLTSLKPLNPSNAPDPWEESVLKAFETGNLKDHYQIININGRPHLRLLSRFNTEESCLKCHRHQGYKVGDTRGGISISIPLAAFIKNERILKAQMGSGFMLLWLIGSVGIATSARLRFQKNRELLTQYEKTEHLNTELTNSRDRLQAILDSLPMRAWLKDRDGRYLMVNSKFAVAAGKAPEEIVGCNDSEVWPPELAKRAIENDREVILKGIRKQTEDLDTLTEEDSWFETFRTPIFDTNGKVTGTAGVSRDITSHVRYQQDLQNARDMAESANRAKSSFLANMSHELRTPMNGIIGMSQLLSFTPLSPEQKEYLGAIEGSADNLLSLINDILDLSKIEAEKMQLDLSDFSLCNAINNVVKPQKPLIMKKGLNLVLEIDDKVPNMLRGDQLRLKQVMMNLLSNAIKFTDNGNISIKINMEEVHQKSCLLHFDVSDTGIGIPPDMIEHIFAPFYQADSSTTRRFDGTGLGLSISQKLSELMGGTIWAESTEGKGSSFHLLLPFEMAEAVPNKPDKSSLTNVPDKTKLNILLAEDNAMNARCASALLKHQGHNVLHVSDGALAVAAWEKARFDIILMDIRMPVMNGVDSMLRIRKLEAISGQHSIIIAVTANALQGDRESFLGEGFDGYISKPFRQQTLLDEIDRCLAHVKNLADKKTHAGPQTG